MELVESEVQLLRWRKLAGPGELLTFLFKLDREVLVEALTSLLRDI